MNLLEEYKNEQTITNDPYLLIQLLYRHLLKNLKKVNKLIKINKNELLMDENNKNEVNNINNKNEEELARTIQVSNEIILELISSLKGADNKTEEFVSYMSGLYVFQLKELNLAYIEMNTDKVNKIYNFFNECNEAWFEIVKQRENNE